MLIARSLRLALLLLLPIMAAAQAPASWQACAGIAAPADRLVCFDRWAETQRSPGGPPAGSPSATAAAQPPAVPASGLTRAEVAKARRVPRLTTLDGCHDEELSPLSRYWELEPKADCGPFGIRGYRPITLAAVTADTVNRQPTSGNPENSAPAEQAFRKTEARLQLSVRTKIASGLLPFVANASDSLWLGYTQQSYWQLFTPSLSRPFRSTDHEPEIMYVMPVQDAKKGEWRVRYAGLGVVHQSNGQSLPYSRSWNRGYLMAGAEKGPFQIDARIWRRLPEGGTDDNPGISDYIGRAEVRGQWQLNPSNMLAATGRHSLDKPGRGSLRLEWFRSIGEDVPSGGLQLHTQLFTGWGDSLLDYNRRRTVFTIGFSLVEW